MVDEDSVFIGSRRLEIPPSEGRGPGDSVVFPGTPSDGMYRRRVVKSGKDLVTVRVSFDAIALPTKLTANSLSIRDAADGHIIEVWLPVGISCNS